MQEEPRRRNNSNRCPDWDYTSPGPYHITTNTHGGQWLLTSVVDGKIVPSVATESVAYWHAALARKYDGVELGELAILPDHVHILIGLPDQRHLDEDDRIPLGAMVAWFKSMVATDYIRRVKRGELPRFVKHIWQRDYDDVIIRDAQHLRNTQRYIRRNPAEWEREHAPLFCA